MKTSTIRPAKRGPDPLDQPGTEVLLDAFSGMGRRGLDLIGLELEAVGAVGDPVAGRNDIFAGHELLRVADHGHDLAMPARLHAQDAVAVIEVVERDALDRATDFFRHVPTIPTSRRMSNRVATPYREAHAYRCCWARLHRGGGIGLYQTFRPTIDSRFVRVQSERGDGMLNHFIL